MGEVYTGTKFNTIFKGDFIPSSEEEVLIGNLIEAGKYLGGMGFKDDNGGNFSARSSRGIIIKTTGSFPHELTKDDFSLVVGFEGDDVYAYGRKEPSSEARLHWEAYNARDDINCVLHTHDFVAVKCPEKVTDVEYIREIPYGTMESARAVKEASKNGDYLLMENHGIIALGKDVDTALKLIKQYHEKFKSIKEGSSSNCRA
jgi:ribulose-5-phosphate 4-epimerase/fuculose-1-phosphate aldolase